MKKLYTFLMLAVGSLSFGQLINENLNYADDALLTDNGWTAHSGGTTNPITVGASNGLSYAGYSGLTGITGAAVGNAALLDNTGQDVNKAFAAPVTSGAVYYSFLVNVAGITTPGYFTSVGSGTTSFAGRVYVQPSANAGKINFGISNNNTAVYGTTDFDLNTTYLVIMKYEVSNGGNASIWVLSSGVPADEASAGTPEATTSGNTLVSIAGIYLRQFAADQNITIDAIYADNAWFGGTPAPTCPLTFGTITKLCTDNTAANDPYTITIPFTGGGTESYTLNADSGTIGGDDPNAMDAGNITISGVVEGTAVVFTATSTNCNLSVNITSPVCVPAPTALPLPWTESFNYTEGNALTSNADWSSINTGDDILVAAGNLSVPGVTSTGNSISFGGAGKEAYAVTETVNSGKIYASFLMSVTDYSNVTTDGQQMYFAAMHGANSTDFRGRIFIKKNADQFLLGASNTSSNAVYGTTAFNVGDVILVVERYDFDTNTLSYWFNPDATTFNESTPADVTETPATAITNISGFVFRQDSATNTPTMTIDELRMSTSSPLAVAQNQIAGLKVYPNPVGNGTLFVETAANGSKTVAIYDVLGKQVVNTTTASSAINVSNLNSGVYIVKITEGSNTATTKLVIK